MTPKINPKVNLIKVRPSKFTACSICGIEEAPIPDMPEIDPLCETCEFALDQGATVDEIQSAYRYYIEEI